MYSLCDTGFPKAATRMYNEMHYRQYFHQRTTIAVKIKYVYNAHSTERAAVYKMRTST